MKRKSLFLAALGVLLLNSCDKDLVVQNSVPATLKIAITGTDVDTRSTVTPSPTQTEENTVNRVTVGLFKSTGGATDVIKEYALSDLTAVSTNTYQASIQGSITDSESGNRDVIVVVNAPANHFAGATTKTAFITKALTLTQVKNNLPMSGVTTATLVANQVVGPVTAQVSRMVARVDLVSLSSAFDPAGPYANASFTADEVFMFNAMTTSTVDCLTTQFPGHGWLQDPLPAPPVIFNPNLGDVINKTFIGSTTYDTMHYFYTFANLFTTNLIVDNLNGPFTMATRLVISGMFKVDKNNILDGGTRVYYPVIVNRVLKSADLTTTKGIGVNRNTIYKISATIKSIGGVTPTTIIDPAYLDFNVEVKNWDLTINQSAEF
jgi:hypothetical protein